MIRINYIYVLNQAVFNFKTYFSFSFCSDFNLETTVVKTEKIKSLKTIVYPALNWIIFFFKLPHSLSKKLRKK